VGSPYLGYPILRQARVLWVLSFELEIVTVHENTTIHHLDLHLPRSLQKLTLNKLVASRALYR